MCGLSTVVTPAGASLTMYREIRSYANSIWDDNNNNNYIGVVQTVFLESYIFLLRVVCRDDSYVFSEIPGIREEHCQHHVS